MNLAEKLWKTADEANAKAHADFYAEVADKKDAILAFVLPEMEKAASEGKTYVGANFSEFFPGAVFPTSMNHLKVRSALRTITVIFEQEGVRVSENFYQGNPLHIQLHWNGPKDHELSHWGYLPR